MSKVLLLVYKIFHPHANIYFLIYNFVCKCALQCQIIKYNLQFLLQKNANIKRNWENKLM